MDRRIDDRQRAKEMGADLFEDKRPAITRMADGIQSLFYALIKSIYSPDRIFKFKLAICGVDK